MNTSSPMTSRPISPGKTSVESTSSATPETSTSPSTADPAGPWPPPLPSLTESISSETTHSPRWLFPHRLSSTATLEEVATEEIQWESTSMPTRLESQKKLARTTKRLTQKASIAPQSKSAKIALDPHQPNTETPILPVSPSRTIPFTRSASTEKSRELLR